jgi:hypothetical protein
MEQEIKKGLKKKIDSNDESFEYYKSLKSFHMAMKLKDSDKDK